MRTHNILTDFFPNWMDSGGIFITMTEAPWYSEGVALYLDEMYFGTWSGRKHPSGLVRALADAHDDYELSSDDRARLGRIAQARFGYAWELYWTALATILDTSESPYDTFKETVTESGTRTTSTLHGHVETLSGTDRTDIDKLENTTETPSGFDTFRMYGERKKETQEQGTFKTETEEQGTFKTETEELGEEQNERSFTGTEADTRTGTTTEHDYGPQKTYTFGFNTTPNPDAEGNGGNLTEVVGHDFTRDTGYQDAKVETSFDNRKNTDKKSFTNRKTVVTETPTNKKTVVTETPTNKKTIVTESPVNYREERERGQKTDTGFTADNSEVVSYGKTTSHSGTDTVTEMPDITKSRRGRSTNKYSILEKIAGTIQFMDFYKQAFRDIDEILTIGVY